MTDLNWTLLFLLLLILLAIIGMIINRNKKTDDNSTNYIIVYLKDSLEDIYYPLRIERLSYHNGFIFLKMDHYNNEYTGLLVKKQRYTDLYTLKEDVDLYLSPQ